jgi:hypothetical protein
MRGFPVTVLTLAVGSIGAFAGCNQDSYSSTPARDTHMGDIRAAENPWVTEPSAPASGTAPTPLDSASTPPASASGMAPAPPGAPGAATGASPAK